MHAGGNPRITDSPEFLTRKTEFNSLQFERALREKSRGARTGRGSPGRPVQMFCAGCSHLPADRNLLFLGPTGSGKTRIVAAAAEILFGDSRAIIKWDCAEFQHSHKLRN